MEESGVKESGVAEWEGLPEWTVFHPLPYDEEFDSIISYS
jgi:hypothetical protein